MWLSRFRGLWLVAELGLAAILAAGGEAGGRSPDPSEARVSESTTRTSSSSSLISDGEGGWRAENGAHQIRVVFSADGIRISPAPAVRPAWDWGISLRRYGGPGDLRSAGYPLLLAGEDRIEYLRGRLVEWFRNGPKGIEHGLEIPDRDGTSLLQFDFAISGSLAPKVSEDGLTVTFRDSSGAPVLADRDLRAVDAEGREVAARWERIEHADDSVPILRLVLEGRDHAFPLRLLGRLATPKGAWTRAGRSSPRPGAEIQSAPANDLCDGAEMIPGAGPFPYLSPIIDSTDATETGDPPAPSCQANVSRSVWFAFTPATGASYRFSVCSEAPTATTVEDTVLALYAGGAACTGLQEIAGGCADDSCGSTGLQSAIDGIDLVAGTTYYLVAWSYGTTVPPQGAGSLQVRVNRNAPAVPPPPNDLCEGAEVIPGDGPFPYLTSITPDISGATILGDPPAPSCQRSVSRSVWYSLTPAIDGRYAFSVCADGPTGSTVDDTVLGVYAATAACSGFQEIPGGCDDDSCGVEGAQSAIAGVGLAAGTRYDIVIWEYGTGPPAIGNTAVQMRVDRIGSVPNDSCAAAAPLTLDAPAAGTTLNALDDTRLASGSGCFTGVGQTPSTAAGVDVVYRFVAPDTARYSFRADGDDSSKNVVLYVASDCPTGAAPATVAGCLAAANRSPANPEEVSCLPLSAGQSVYVYVDEDIVTSGSPFTIEATRCLMAGEPDGAPASAGEPACGMEGSIVPGGDADFFTLGIPAPGSRVFALVDGAAGSSTDFDLRVTTDVDTLEYDDFNNDVPFGSVSPNVSGCRLNGSASYARVSHYSPLAQAEPYHLYVTVQPSASQATAEVEPDDTVATATGGANEYYAGALSGAADVDVFSFQAVAGELVQIGLDLDPARDNTPFNGSLALLDGTGTSLLLVNDPSSNASNATGNGSLTATTPFAPGEALVFRIRSTGTYYAKVAWSSGTPGDYLLSISHDCRVGPPTDLTVTQSDTPDPVLPSGTVTYSILVGNPGANPASVVTLRDTLPAGAALVSAHPSQGSCVGTGPVVCHLGDLGAGATAGVSVVVTAPAAPGPLTNTIRVSSAVIDPFPGNDQSSETTMVGSTDGDGDGIPDAADCAPADPAVWAIPGEATGPVLTAATGATLLQWSAPPSPGGTAVRFDLLRSASAANFQAPTCLAADTSATSTTDAGIPGPISYYLVRAENVCGGNVGTRSDGTPRTAGACP